MITKTRTLVTTNDGEQIAVWKISADQQNLTVADTLSKNALYKDIPSKDTAQINTAKTTAQNIFLTHGTFSDQQTCLKIAEYFAHLGHHCYIMEWRGHGDSAIPQKNFNFETVATYDYEATFRYFFGVLKLDNLHCVTHSGGGVGLTMFLIQNPDYIAKINSITLFACQAYGAALRPVSHAKISAAKYLTRLLGHIPAKTLKMGPINESYYTMRQWFNWNLQRNFYSSFIKSNAADDVFDYRQYMPQITIPIYAISAKGDHLISPTQGCRLFFDDFKNPNNVFREYALSHGDLDDYTHSRIMISRHAAKEIWPTVTAWIEKHAR